MNAMSSIRCGSFVGLDPAGATRRFNAEVRALETHRLGTKHSKLSSTTPQGRPERNAHNDSRGAGGRQPGPCNVITELSGLQPARACIVVMHICERRGSDTIGVTSAYLLPDEAQAVQQRHC